MRELIDIPEEVELYHAHSHAIGEWCVRVPDLGRIIAAELERLAEYIGAGVDDKIHGPPPQWIAGHQGALFAVASGLRSRAAELRKEAK